MLCKGDYIELLESVVPWYSSYGGRRQMRLDVGLVGVVTATDCVDVRGSRRGRFVVSFVVEGESWQASFYPDGNGRAYRVPAIGCPSCFAVAGLGFPERVPPVRPVHCTFHAARAHRERIGRSGDLARFGAIPVHAR